jgi:hypothetical protein
MLLAYSHLKRKFVEVVKHSQITNNNKCSISEYVSNAFVTLLLRRGTSHT